MVEKLKLIQQQKSFDLVIPDDVERKIRHLCSIVHNIEWSGILFYTTEGSFEEDDFKATCLDIFVMDVGDGGYTKFPDTSEIAHYRAWHPELLAENVHEGLIHSHHNMARI